MVRLPLLALVAIAATLSSATAADLSVEVQGLAGTGGNVIVALFASVDSFPDHPATLQKVPATDRPTVAVFRGLQPGTYAVAAFHDNKMNDRLDKNLIGVPTEKFGFSRDARANLGPPAFAAAAFPVDNTNQSITVTLR